VGWSSGSAEGAGRQQATIFSSLGGIASPHPVAFWLGTLATTIGVILHLPMYVSGREMGYRLVGMPKDNSMLIGMALILVGLVASLDGLYPRSAEVTAGLVSRIRVRALDEAPIRAATSGFSW
jgi:MFS transporter, putative metabolite:H+ symporter